ncbi:FtsH protease activity modulator HflK [Microvirga sp. W0021]|uniref:Protein HflK n=1 Tax=Hohaiivirga grylli TaxID=3133970 RepID=A0ABV0BLZ6_9HYPH
MPWSNQSGGPWGQKGGSDKGDKTPWGSGGNGGNNGGGGNNNQPPNLEELIRQSQDKLKNIFGGSGGGRNGGTPAKPSLGGKGALFIVLAAVVVWLLTGIYTVRPTEMGVNMIFGRYTGSTGEGLNYNLPYPIGQVIKQDVTTQRRTEIGLGNRDQRNTLGESLMLTGDENIVDVSFFVIWQVDSANVDKYTFTLADPAETVKVVAESAMREVIGRSNIQSIITTTDQSATAQKVQDTIQQALDSYGAGILVRAVQVSAAVPPAQVREAFMDVNAAQQDAVRAQNDAERDASQIVPKARGEAAEIIQKAEGYKAQMVAEGTGQAVYFKDLYAAYATAPDIIRQRIFLETMENVLKDSNKVILDQKAQGAGVLPLLPLAQPDARK